MNETSKIVAFVKSTVDLFRASKPLRQALKHLQEAYIVKSAPSKRPLVLVCDVVTRWNSTEFMIRRWYELSDFVKQALMQCTTGTAKYDSKHSAIARGLLTNFDQRVKDVRALHLILGKCRQTSDLMEGHKGQTSQLLFVVDSLEKHLKVSNTAIATQL